MLGNDITQRAVDDIIAASQNGCLHVATDPRVIAEINNVLAQDTTSIFDVAQVIRTEPVLAAKIMQVANSALLCLQPCSSLNDGISRLGMSIVRNLAMCILLKNAFNTQHSRLEEVMNEVTRSTSLIAGICGAISKEHAKLKTDVAVLVGLMSNIGKMAALAYIDANYSADQIERMYIHDVINLVNPRVGRSILTRWGMPQPIIDAAFSDGVCDTVRSVKTYKDVAILARLHDRGHTDQQTAVEIGNLLHVHRNSIEEFLKLIR